VGIKKETTSKIMKKKEKPIKGWKEDKEIGFWYPTKKWLKEFELLVNKLSLTKGG